MRLTPEQRQRFFRQIALPEIGERGQERLLAGRVLVVGIGGLGSAAGLYLAAAGVGTIGLADDDRVELGNLQRQILYAVDDIGHSKVESGAAKLRAIHPGLTVRRYMERVTADNAPAMLKEYDFIIDATDHFESKCLIAEACHVSGKPYSHAGILRYYGQTITVLPGKTACWRCVFQQLPTGDGERPQSGPLGVVPGVIGTIQAAEAIKYLLGIGTLLTNRLLTFDALTMNIRCVPIKRNAHCSLCGTN